MSYDNLNVMNYVKERFCTRHARFAELGNQQLMLMITLLCHIN